MEKNNKKLYRLFADLIVHTTEKKAHSSCHGYMYEPEVPKNINII